MNDEKAARRAAFGGLARQYESDLIRLASRLCQGNSDRAQDLVQDALVRAYQAYCDGRFQEGTNARSWLLRILTNLFINDYNRRRKWEAGVDLDTLTCSGEAGPPQTLAAEEDVPGMAMLAAILDEEIEAALATVAEPYRLCIVLVDMEGMDYAEAAAALDVPVGTVRSRLSRGRMILHDLLKDYAKRKGILP